MELILLVGVLLIGVAGVSLSVYGKYWYVPKRDTSRKSKLDNA